MKEILKNQLPIEILINDPKWTSQFDKYQKRQIRLGLEQNLDVSNYAKPEFTWVEMCEIRISLEKGLDVSVYAKPEFNNEQMYEIRRGLEDNLDVSIYAKPEFNDEKMRQIRERLYTEKNTSKSTSN